MTRCQFQFSLYMCTYVAFVSFLQVGLYYLHALQKFFNSAVLSRKGFLIFSRFSELVPFNGQLLERFPPHIINDTVFPYVEQFCQGTGKPLKLHHCYCGFLFVQQCFHERRNPSLFQYYCGFLFVQQCCHGTGKPLKLPQYYCAIFGQQYCHGMDTLHFIEVTVGFSLSWDRANIQIFGMLYQCYRYLIIFKFSRKYSPNFFYPDCVVIQQYYGKYFTIHDK